MKRQTMKIYNHNIIHDVCIEMFQARQYSISFHDENTIHGLDEHKQKVFLYILSCDKLNTQIMRYYYSEFLKNNVKRGILVYHHLVTPSVKKIIESIDNIVIELFSKNELSFNITKHHLVPTHIRIEKDPTIDYTKYPIIKRQDPIAKFYNFRHNDLIKIIRSDDTIYYRITR